MCSYCLVLCCERSFQIAENMTPYYESKCEPKLLNICEKLICTEVTLNIKQKRSSVEQEQTLRWIFENIQNWKVSQVISCLHLNWKRVENEGKIYTEKKTLFSLSIWFVPFTWHSEEEPYPNEWKSFKKKMLQLDLILDLGNPIHSIWIRS